MFLRLGQGRSSSAACLTNCSGRRRSKAVSSSVSATSSQPGLAVSVGQSVSGASGFPYPRFFGHDYHPIVEPLETFRALETQAKCPPAKAGDHLMRMTINAFRYVADARDMGALVPGYGEPEENPFKREARVHAGRDAAAP